MTAITPSAIYSGHNSHIEQSATSNKINAPRFKVGYITVTATADNADYIEVNIWKRWGMIVPLAVKMFTQSTADSIIIEEAGTTILEGRILRITIGGSTANKKRTFAVYGI